MMASQKSSHPKQIGAFGKVRLLVWKNFLIQIRHKFHTVLDLLMPIVFFSLIVWVHYKTGSTKVEAQTYSDQPIENAYFPP